MAAYDNLLANVPTDLWIGGKWKKSSDGARFDVIDPATERKIASVAKTHRAFSVEENPRLCGWGAEIMSIIADEAFYDLDGPLVRITTPHCPLPAADILEDAILPTVDRIVDRVSKTLNS